MSELIGDARKRALKELIRRAHAGANVEELKAEFQEKLGNLTPVEIAKLEQELVHLLQLYFHQKVDMDTILLQNWVVIL